MATPLWLKRITRERRVLDTPNSDYFVNLKDNDLSKFEAYVIGPADTLYSHKFIKLRFEIPQNYPLSPPKCLFVQHSGGRIHPNLYVEGKVCLSILGTWAGEPWALAMTIETVLITVRSLLDNSPYKHEPGCNDNPNFNQFVQYSTWRSCLIDYLKHEKDLAAQKFLRNYLCEHGSEMLAELRKQQNQNSHVRQFTTPYSCRGQPTIPQYDNLISELLVHIDAAKAEKESEATEQPGAVLSTVVPRDLVSTGVDATQSTNPSNKTTLESSNEQISLRPENPRIFKTDTSVTVTTNSSALISNQKVIDLTQRN